MSKSRRDFPITLLPIRYGIRLIDTAFKIFGSMFNRIRIFSKILTVSSNSMHATLRAFIVRRRLSKFTICRFISSPTDQCKIKTIHLLCAIAIFAISVTCVSLLRAVHNARYLCAHHAELRNLDCCLENNGDVRCAGDAGRRGRTINSRRVSRPTYLSRRESHVAAGSSFRHLMC